MSIYGKIIEPADCAMAFAIPTSVQEFLDDLSHPRKEFAKMFEQRYTVTDMRQEFQGQIGAYVEDILPVIKELGVQIYTGVTLEKFGELLLAGKFQVIILFAHWDNMAIEFHDGFHGVTAILEKVPENFAGILDLCVCHPRDLTVALRQHRPACLTKYIDNRATPYFWLFFYLALFKDLSSHNRSYPDSFDSTLREFRKKRKC